MDKIDPLIHSLNIIKTFYHIYMYIVPIFPDAFRKQEGIATHSQERSDQKIDLCNARGTRAPFPCVIYWNIF